VVGGGELNDHELCRLLSAEKIRSHELTLECLRKYKNHNLIISNFINLRQEVKNEIMLKYNYVIYEHDHKYLASRNPATYKDFLAPKEQIINLDFYKQAKCVFCQSSFHQNIMKKNIQIENIHNVSGNLWSKGSLQILKILSRKEKKDRYTVLNSKIWHKNTAETAFYCDKKGFAYDLISSNDYNEFLSLLSGNDKFIFLPKTPETLSRVVVEARMMGIKTITNKNIGASYEPWYSTKGVDLIKYMEAKHTEVKSEVLRRLNE
jgi:hypothetical protein